MSSSGGLRVEWWRVEAVVSEWRRSVHPSPRVYGVADRSLRHKLDRHGVNELRSWQRRGQAQLPSWADPVICELAEEDDAAYVISNDEFRGLRREFPFLQGFDRLYGFEIRGRQDVTLMRKQLAELPSAEISRAYEDELRTPRRLRNRDGQHLLKHEWACDNLDCYWSSYPAIEDLPINDRGTARCPECEEPLREVGWSQDTREFKVLVEGDVAERVPVAVGTSVVVGRRSGRDALDIRQFLESRPITRISRDHLRISNINGKLYAEDLGSTNGSRMSKADGGQVQLEEGASCPCKKETVSISQAVSGSCCPARGTREDSS